MPSLLLFVEVSQKRCLTAPKLVEVSSAIIVQSWLDEGLLTRFLDLPAMPYLQDDSMLNATKKNYLSTLNLTIRITSCCETDTLKLYYQPMNINRSSVMRKFVSLLHII